MQFTSIGFLLFWLPAILLAFHLANKKSVVLGHVVLLAASLVFCGMSDLWSLAILICEILIGYFFSGRILKSGAGTVPAKRFLIGGILLQVLTLCFFKYTGFLVGNIGWLLGEDLFWQNVILPLGISYTTFTQIAYLTDCYQGRIRQPADLLTYALYLSFFPKLAQGPIASGTALITAMQQERPRGLAAGDLSEGIVLFVLGLSKKVLIADVFGRVTDMGFSRIIDLSSGDALVVILSYTFQIYFDFSGYSDMAIGLARMFGYALPVNFNSPYRAESMTDFWRRWHMSLTDFLRNYLYFPLGGSRRGTVRTCLNILIVFVVSGFWHGANWTFLLWGLLHGLLQVAERLGKRVFDRIPCIVRRVYTFSAASLLWLLFRSSSVAECRRILWHLVWDWHWGICTEILEIFRLPGLRGLMRVMGWETQDVPAGWISLFVWMALAFGLCLQKRNNESGPYRRRVSLLVVTTVLYLICLFSVNDVSAFIYTSF